MKLRTLRLTDEQVAALEMLGEALGIAGQRGATFNPVIAAIADIAARPETVDALQIAMECADGEEWGEAVKSVRPESK